MHSRDEPKDSHAQPVDESVAEPTLTEPTLTEPAAAATAPTSAAAGTARRGPSTINIRNFSLRCGRCNQYMVLVGFGHLDADWNLYTYECETEPCASDPSVTRTFLEVPADLDEFANRDPNWRGGQKWGGA